jgi:hypothetical protein
MNILAYFLIGLGVLQFASIGYDECRGVTSSPSDGSATVLPATIQKQSEPDQFHNAIVCHCYYAFTTLMFGILMLVVEKRMDKSDPTSPDFAGNKALDDWAIAMKKTEEIQKESRDRRFTRSD